MVRVLRNISIRYKGKIVSCSALLDTGSRYTIIQGSFFKENFGEDWHYLEKPHKVHWINGQSITINKYAVVDLIIDDYILPEIVFIIDNFVKEIEVNGKKIKLPEVIIGSGTMDKYDIVIELEKGVYVRGLILLV